MPHLEKECKLKLHDLQNNTGEDEVSFIENSAGSNRKALVRVEDDRYNVHQGRLVRSKPLSLLKFQ